MLPKQFPTTVLFCIIWFKLQRTPIKTWIMFISILLGTSSYVKMIKLYFPATSICLRYFNGNFL